MKLSIIFYYFVLLIIATGDAANLSARELNPIPITRESSETIILNRVTGKVEYYRTPPNKWNSARRSLPLAVEDQVQTGEFSLAQISVGDLHNLALHSESLIGFKKREHQLIPYLKHGKALYSNRRRTENQIRFETDLVRGEFFGTEVLVIVEKSGETRVAIIDGNVKLENQFGKLELKKNEEAIVNIGEAPKKVAALYSNQNIQWTMYYPAVLDPTELRVTSAELEKAFQAYLKGNLPAASMLVPPQYLAKTNSERIFIAAVRLAVGGVEYSKEEINDLLRDNLSVEDRHLAQALHRLIQIVTKQQRTIVGRIQTASEWMAESYARQAALNLEGALEAARHATVVSPNFSFAWARVAELEYSFGRSRQAHEAVEKSLSLAPENAQALAIKGFILAGKRKNSDAFTAFNQALNIDSGAPAAWMGLGIMQIQKGDVTQGVTSIHTAVSLEPQIAVNRSYLGKAFHESGKPELALKELKRAIELDPNDPTAWHYSALIHHEQNNIYGAISDLEKSKALNRNRAVYRSSYLLDEDQAVRSANLALLYSEAGLQERGLEEARQALTLDYANYSAHGFLANAYNLLRDPGQFNLRYETPAISEYLLANLLSPPDAGLFSPTASHNEHSRLFQQDGLGIFSQTDYMSRGAWSQVASQFGNTATSSYRLDYQYRSDPGEYLYSGLEQQSFFAQAKQRLGSNDHIYLQGIVSEHRSGDRYPYYNPAQADPTLQIREKQQPLLALGWHHIWHPGSHTLLLLSGGTAEQRISTDYHPVLLGRINTNGIIDGVPVPTRDFPNSPYGTLNLKRDFEFYSGEIQQILKEGRHQLVLGARFQTGEFENQSLLGNTSRTALGSRNSSAPPPSPNAPVFRGVSYSQSISPELARAEGYGYYQLEITESLIAAAGLSYSWLEFPMNPITSPLSEAVAQKDEFSPKGGLQWNFAPNWNAALTYARTLGGASFENSFRMEPTHVLGMNQAFRSVVPFENLPGERTDIGALRINGKIGDTIYTGAEANLLFTEAEHVIGIGLLDPEKKPGPSGDASFAGWRDLSREVNFEERSLKVYLHKIWFDAITTGARHGLTASRMKQNLNSFPRELYPEVFDIEESRLFATQLFMAVNHHSGIYAQADAEWFVQRNSGFGIGNGEADFWQYHLWIGYRFPGRYFDLRAGVLNLTDQDYRLQPLSLTTQIPRERTFFTSLRIQF
ncbi:MAG: tetratricopeptide repeat protein [Verrucomicrobiales bacterium]